jgi:type VI secretion system secreted protein Hcp
MISTKKILMTVAAVALVATIAVVASPAVAPVDAASADYYLQIDNVKGSAKGGAIEVNSWSFGASNPSSVGSSGMGAGKVTISSFNFMKKVDRSSPSLMKAASNGDNLGTVTVSIRLAGTTGYATVKLSDAMISSYGVNGTMESVSFNFSKIEFSYPK